MQHGTDLSIAVMLNRPELLKKKKKKGTFHGFGEVKKSSG